VSSEYLKEEKEASVHVIESILRSHRSDETVAFSFKRKEFKLSIGLTEIAVRKLEQAIEELRR